MITGHHPDKEVARAERRKRVLVARLRGDSFRTIAEREKISTSTAHADMSTALADIPRQEADELRQQEEERLNALQAAYWEAALSGNLEAADRVLRIIDRRARLLGLDAPQRMEIAAGDVDLDGTVAKILQVAEIAIRHGEGGEGGVVDS